MDHVDWLEAAEQAELAAALAAHVAPGGKVIWRSASVAPPYATVIGDHGFDVRRLQVRLLAAGACPVSQQRLHNLYAVVTVQRFVGSSWCGASIMPLRGNRGRSFDVRRLQNEFWMARLRFAR